MNLAHVHLILNHVPLMTIPIALIFLIYALLRDETELKRFSLMILVATAAMVLPVYLTGEPAEHLIENLPGVAEHAIESHEDAAKISLILTILGGALAAAALVVPSQKKLGKILPVIVVLSCLLAVGSLGYTANLGGKIRHPEISGSSELIDSGKLESE